MNSGLRRAREVSRRCDGIGIVPALEVYAVGTESDWIGLS